MQRSRKEEDRIRCSMTKRVELPSRLRSLPSRLRSLRFLTAYPIRSFSYDFTALPQSSGGPDRHGGPVRCRGPVRRRGPVCYREPVRCRGPDVVESLYCHGSPPYVHPDAIAERQKPHYLNLSKQMSGLIRLHVGARRWILQARLSPMLT
jgi:hypothetical protein